MSREAPDNAEPAMKTRRPRRKNLCRPYRSDSFPKIGIVTVCTMRKALKTHAKRFKPPRSAMIVGAAVETIVTSMKPRSSPARRPASTRGADRPGFGGTSAMVVEGFMETAEPTMSSSWAPPTASVPFTGWRPLRIRMLRRGIDPRDPSIRLIRSSGRGEEILRGAWMFSARAGSDLERREPGRARSHPGALGPEGCGRRQRPEQSLRGLARPNRSRGLHRVPERHDLLHRWQHPGTPLPLRLHRGGPHARERESVGAVRLMTDDR